METPGPTSGTPPITAIRSDATTVRWQPGQLLQATVVESTLDKVLLAIGNRQVSSETSLLLDKGQQLTLQVRSLGDLPVLRIVSGLTTPPLAQAVRALLPQQDAMTPLLASLASLAKTSYPSVPPLIRELTRAMVNNLPDTTALTRPENLQKAIQQSGLFLERRLLQQLNPSATPASNPAPVSAIQQDFKANLLQLIQRLRNWPGSAPTPAPATATKSTTATVQTGNLPPPAATGQAGTAQTTTTSLRGGNPGTAMLNNPANPAQTPPPTTDQLRRVVRAATTPAQGAGARPAAASGTVPPGTSPTTATTATPTSSVALPGSAPPPFPGAAPAPQAAVQATIDLLNRIGNLRTDLLQQAEKALARIQLHQLASSHPRQAEHGLLEWLLELPVRRGDEIDLWSMRIAREEHEQAARKAQARHHWSVQLAFDLPGLGPVQAQVTLAGERVSTRFWTGREDTLPLFREHLQKLQDMLGHAGLEVGSLDCIPGPMPARAVAPQLIREKV